MSFSGVRKTQGFNFNFYQKIEVNWNQFGGSSTDGYSCDVAIPFSTQTVMFLNEESSGVIEYSLDGYHLAGELDPTLPSRGMTFDNRIMCLIWLRVKAGSTGPLTLRIDSWARP